MRAAIVVMKPVDEESIKRQWNLKKKNREDADIPGKLSYQVRAQLFKRSLSLTSSLRGQLVMCFVIL